MHANAEHWHDSQLDLCMTQSIGTIAADLISP